MVEQLDYTPAEKEMTTTATQRDCWGLVEVLGGISCPHKGRYDKEGSPAIRTNSSVLASSLQAVKKRLRQRHSTIILNGEIETENGICAHTRKA